MKKKPYVQPELEVIDYSVYLLNDVGVIIDDRFSDEVVIDVPAKNNDDWGFEENEENFNTPKDVNPWGD